jgi:hypothetical protein
MAQYRRISGFLATVETFGTDALTGKMRSIKILTQIEQSFTSSFVPRTTRMHPEGWRGGSEEFLGGLWETTTKFFM